MIGNRPDNSDNIPAPGKTRSEDFARFRFAHPEKPLFNVRVFRISQLETVGIGKCLCRFDKGNPMLFEILDFFGQIPFEFHKVEGTIFICIIPY